MSARSKDPIKICWEKGIIINPVIKGDSFQLVVSKYDKEIKRYDKLISGNEVGKAMEKTYKYLSKTITE